MKLVLITTIILKLVLVSSVLITRSKTKKDLEFYFTHEINYKYALTALDNGNLLSRSLLDPNMLTGKTNIDAQQVNTGACGPILFTRIVDETATGRLNSGSVGSSSSVMFVINPTVAEGSNMENSKGKDFIGLTKTYNKHHPDVKGTYLRLPPPEYYQKVCYSSSSDLGKTGLYPTFKFYLDFNTKEKVYDEAKLTSYSGDIITEFNEQGWSGGITINDENIALVLVKFSAVKKEKTDRDEYCLVISRNEDEDKAIVYKQENEKLWRDLTSEVNRGLSLGFNHTTVFGDRIYVETRLSNECKSFMEFQYGTRTARIGFGNEIVDLYKRMLKLGLGKKLRLVSAYMPRKDIVELVKGRVPEVVVSSTSIPSFGKKKGRNSY